MPSYHFFAKCSKYCIFIWEWDTKEQLIGTRTKELFLYAGHFYKWQLLLSDYITLISGHFVVSTTQIYHFFYVAPNSSYHYSISNHFLNFYPTTFSLREGNMSVCNSQTEGSAPIFFPPIIKILTKGCRRTSIIDNRC